MGVDSVEGATKQRCWSCGTEQWLREVTRRYPVEHEIVVFEYHTVNDGKGRSQECPASGNLAPELKLGCI